MWKFIKRTYYETRYSTAHDLGKFEDADFYFNKMKSCL